MKIYTIHGNAQSEEIFSKVQLDNIEHITLPGHGSSKKLSDYSLEYYVDYVNDIITEPCLLLGHSLGGHIAINACERCQNIKGMVITGTPPLSNETFSEAFLANESLGILFQEERDDSLLEDFLSLQTKDHELKALLKKMYNEQHSIARSSFNDSLSLGVNNEIDILKKTNVPFLLSFGDKENIANVSYTEALDLGEVYKFKSAHNVMWENPKEYIDVVNEFIYKLE